MVENNPAKLIHIVDDFDAKAIEKGYYEELKNTELQQFIGVGNTKELKEYYHIEPMINQSYVFDKSNQSYILFDDDIEMKFSKNRLNAYIVVFKFMGATSIEGKIVECIRKGIKTEKGGGIAYKTVNLKADVRKKLFEDFSRTIQVKREDKNKITKSYEEIRNYLAVHGLMNDTTLSGRLEELKTVPELSGSYQEKVTLTHNLKSIWEIGAKVSATPIFEANGRFQERCKHYTEVDFELIVSFD